MTYYNWNVEKNEKLINERGISFEKAVWCIDNGGLVDIIEHPNKKKYPGQKILIISIDGYINRVPYVESDEKIFLKTIIPSRKETKKYLGGKK